MIGRKGGRKEKERKGKKEGTPCPSNLSLGLDFQNY
jgi:hypothetical protein